MKKTVGIALAVVVGAGIAAGSLILWRRAQARPPAVEATAPGTPVLVATATRGTLADQLVVTGTAQADQDSTINAEVPGHVVAVYVHVGDHVTAGQTLLRMDTSLAAAQLAQSAAEVRSAQARQAQAQENVHLTQQSTEVGVREGEIGVQAAREQLAKAQKSYDLTKSSIDLGVSQAQTSVDQAQATLKDVQAGARAQEIAEAQAALDEARASLRQAQSDYRRQQDLLAAGAISAQQLEVAQTTRDVARSRVDQAAQALSLAQAGARTEQVRLAELGVQQARQALQLAESRRDQVAVAERDVNAAAAALSNAQQQLALARAQRQQVAMQQEEAQAAAASVGQAQAGEQYARTGLTKLYVPAPFSGQVAERLVEPGTSVDSSTPLLRIVSLQPMKVTAQVSELEIARLHGGQAATVTVDGLPGQIFPGRLARLSPAANPGERRYDVQVQVDNRQGLIKPGMFCRVTVVLQTIPDAIIIPRDALVENGAQREVYVVQAGKIVVKTVQIGAQSNGRVQAVAGVQAGDQLVVAGQSLLAAGQAVKPQQH